MKEENIEAKILYLQKINISLNEDITFLKVLLTKIDNQSIELRDRMYSLLSAYIEEKKKASILLSQLDDDLKELGEDNKEIYEQYFTNKNILSLCKYVDMHYKEDLKKIRDILDTIDREYNLINDHFLHLTPIERMSLYQTNMDYLDSK